MDEYSLNHKTGIIEVIDDAVAWVPTHRDRPHVTTYAAVFGYKINFCSRFV